MDLFAITVAILKKSKRITTLLQANKGQTSVMCLHTGVPQETSEISLNEHFGLQHSWGLSCTFW